MLSVFDAIRLVFRKRRDMGLFTKGYLDQMLLIERTIINLRNSYEVTKVNNAIWVVIRTNSRQEPDLANFLFDLEALLNMECFKPKVANQQEVSARHRLPFVRRSRGLSIPPQTQQGVSAHGEVSARCNFQFGIISRGLSIPRHPPPCEKPPLPPIHNEPNYLVGHPVPLEPNQFDCASIDQMQPVFDGIRLAFQNGQNNAWLKETHLDQMLLIERAVVNLRNSYEVTKVNNAIWVVIHGECRLVNPNLARFLLSLEALLNMECFKPKVANQQEVSARHSLPFDRISRGLSVQPPPHREVSTGREVSAPRRSLPFVRRSRGLSIPPPPRGKPPLPPVHNEPNYVLGHPVPLEPNQSDYDSIDQTQKHVPSAQEQVQRQLTPAKETTEKLAVDDPVFSQQISSHDAPQKTPQKSAWEKFRSKKSNEQPRKVEKKEEKQRKKKDDKPKWNF